MEYTLHCKRLPVACQMMEEGICFSPNTLKLTTVVRCYSRQAVVLAREMCKCTFMLLTPRLNTSGCVYGRTVILKNCIVRKQHLDHRIYFITLNVHVVRGNNSTIQSNYRTRNISKYTNHHRL